ncbi:MAG TPA: hypothetical protein VMZ28_15460 [Kofleriaceae bacterium]|nr:hypothetical protein [Kofleriaceae bacterium]
MNRTTTSLWLVLVLGACGRVKGPGGGGDGDGGAGDGDGGSGADAAVPGLVEVTVLSETGLSEPREDIPVVFFQPDGTAEATEMTDADGKASAELLPGGAVVVFTHIELAGTLQTQLWAALAVQPGDSIVFGRRKYVGEVTANMTIRLPIAKSIDFKVTTPCGTFSSNTRDVPVVFYDHCDDSPFGALGVMTAGEDQYEISGGDIDIDDGLTVPLPGDYALVPSPDVTVEGLENVSGVSASWQAARVGDSNLALGLGPLVEGTADTDTLTLAPRKAVTPDEVMLQLDVYDEQPQLGRQFYSLWSEGGGDEDPVLIDLADVAMPRVGQPVFEQATRHFGWSQVGDGDWDATYVTFFWQQVDGKVVTSNGLGRVLVPPGVHEVVLPPVPVEYEAWLPESLDQIAAQVTLFDAELLDADGARQLGFAPSAQPEYQLTHEPQTVRYAMSPSVD